MLERLDAERRHTASAALQAMEEERARVARDLHDEVNQSLTGVLLHLEAAREKASPEVDRRAGRDQGNGQPGHAGAVDAGAPLRPTALDDLGLKAALAGHVEELARKTDIAASFEADGDFSACPRDPARRLPRRPGGALERGEPLGRGARPRAPLAPGEGLEMTVSDDGQGFTLDEEASGLGIPGMRERALLIGGELEIESNPPLGTRIRLRV